MATVTGLTAARMLAIEAATVVGGAYDSSGHLILTQHDGTEIDAGVVPDATEVLKGIAELATEAETEARVEPSKIVTPASLASTIDGLDDRLDALEAIKVQIITGIAETAPQSSYPTGFSLMNLAPGSGWTPNSGIGSVVTRNIDADHCFQTFEVNAGGAENPRVWTRSHHSTSSGGGWTAWQQIDVLVNLSPANYGQSTVFTLYPQGSSRIYFTTSNSSSWDFSGKAGEVVTYSDGSTYARQTWYQHINGNSSSPEVWVRTAGNLGWSKWTVRSGDTGWVNLSYASGFTAGTAEQLQYRMKDKVVYIRGGATGTYTAGTYHDVANPGAIPSTYRPDRNIFGGATGAGARPSVFQIAPDGSVKLGSNLTSMPTWISMSADYPV